MMGETVTEVEILCQDDKANAIASCLTRGGAKVEMLYTTKDQRRVMLVTVADEEYDSEH